VHPAESGAVGLDAPQVEETAVSILNVPNLLSISRILAVPIFIILMLEPDPGRALAAAIVFLFASATDWLDGYLARKWGQVTKMGKLLDPIADKILVASALIILVNINKEDAWLAIAAIVIIGREFAVTGLRAIASSEGIIIPAETTGKYKTGTQIIAILSFVLDYHMETSWLTTLGWITLIIAVILSAYSAVQYFMQFWKKLKR
jgi:CDP-diacylglycerol--glycerol-3-phosphate 3-phosphatidyltransferase